MNKNEIFTTIQNFLKDPPVIIWGSGATVPYKIPSMNELTDILNIEGIKIDRNSNLETKLSEISKSEPKKINDIKKTIINKILEKDLLCLENSIKDKQFFSPIISMVKCFIKPQPEKIDIITSNYDRILEYALTQENIPYTEGFSGRILSKFDMSLFREKGKFINLIKVHGSLNWMSYENEIFYIPVEYNNFKINIQGMLNNIILPTKDKFEDSYKNPYRQLIAQSDECIQKAKSFLVVGFGFNDKHITPIMENKIKEGVPIVIITKQATQSCIDILNKATNYCLLQEDEKNTNVTCSKQKQPDVPSLEGKYWELNNFMEIFENESTG